MWQHLWPAGSCRSRPRRSLYTRFALLLGLVSSIHALSAHADDFAKVYYDASTDELVVTMIYSGTNPDHAFSLRWGQCKEATDSNASEVEVEVLDSQWGGPGPPRLQQDGTIRLNRPAVPACESHVENGATVHLLTHDPSEARGASLINPIRGVVPGVNANCGEPCLCYLKHSLQRIPAVWPVKNVMGILNIGHLSAGKSDFGSQSLRQISTALMRPSSGRLVIDFFPVPF